MRELGRFGWVVILSLWATLTSFFTWTLGQARSMEMRRVVDGQEVVVTAEQQMEEAYQMLIAGGLLWLVGLTVAFVTIAWGVWHISVRRGTDDTGRGLSIAFGWVPGLMLAFLSMGAGYLFVGMIYGALAGVYSIHHYTHPVARFVELLCATAVSAIWL